MSVTMGFELRVSVALDGDQSYIEAEALES